MEGDTVIAAEITDKTNSFLIQTDKIRSLAERICDKLNVSDYELHVQFVENDDIQSINQQTRGKNSPTDVLSFPQNQWLKPLCIQDREKTAGATTNASTDFPSKHLGDILISPAKAMENASQIDQGLDREICFLLVHGILHLCGHDHINESEAELMFKEQKKMMTWIELDESAWANCVRMKN